MGMTDKEIEGDWRWLDGTNPDYLPWGKNQPNNYGISNCGAFYEQYDFQWVDEPCKFLYQPICEIVYVIYYFLHLVELSNHIKI